MNQPLVQRVCVVFSDTPEGAIALTFASDLVKNAGLGKLAVFLGINAAASVDANTEQRSRVAAHVAHTTSLAKDEFEIFEFDAAQGIAFPQHSLIVDHALVSRIRDRHVLTPYDETTLNARADGPIVIPFGDGDSGRDAASAALELAARLGKSVVFYHTTWRADIDSDDPRDHLCPEAEAVLSYLEETAQQVGVQFKTKLEMASDVAEGILHAAVDEGASLIVLARGRKTKAGSYVDQVVEQSPFPTMVATANPALKPLGKPTARPARRTRQALAAATTAQLGKRNAVFDFLRNNVGNPVFVMSVVAVMYIVKAIVKITLGTAINSPMLTGDGLHNIADIFEALAVILVIKVSLRPPSERYAYGRKNIEFVSAGAIGLGLIGMSALFAVKSVTGILHYFPDVDSAVRGVVPMPAFEPLIMSSAHFPWVVAATAGSVLLSWFVSRYQIRVGKKTGHDSLIADGEETASDGRIEMVALVGVLAEYIFHSPWIEYPLGIVIAVLIFRTGRELWMKAWHVLLQHTIGVEHDQEIRHRIGTTPGVTGAESVKTFQVGRIAVCHLTVTTRCATQTVNHIKYAIERSVEGYVLAQDFHKVETHINFQPPGPNRHRRAIAIIRSGSDVIVAPTVEEANAFLILDFEFGRIIRATEEEAQDNPLSLLSIKRVSCVQQFARDSQMAPQLRSLGIEVQPAVSYLPAALGFSSNHPA
jgi:cation diffusion facilitator family transporter